MPETPPQISSEQPVSDALGASVALGSLLQSAGIASAGETGWIRITGEDRVRWLNGMLTNSIQALQPGGGCYNFLLNAQGRIQGDAYAFAEAQQILLRTERSQIAALTTHLDRYIIMDDVELSDVSGDWDGLVLAGPLAGALLRRVGIGPEMSTPGLKRCIWNGKDIIVVRLNAPLVPRIELWADVSSLEALSAALVAEGALPVEEISLEQLRLLEGTPRFGTDIRDRELPQETGQTAALHFAKGCYLGQEIVERIRSRGSVHRVFGGFFLQGELPCVGAVLSAEGKAVGELTSVAEIPLASVDGGPVLLALGYARRETIERGVPITYDGGTAVPVALPYLQAQQIASKFLREGHDHA